MGIGYVTYAAAEANTLTMPAHQAGDFLLMFAYETSGSDPAVTNPDGWISMSSDKSFSERGGLLSFRNAVDSSTPSGTWTNATHLLCAVYRSDVGLYLYPSGVGAWSGSNISSVRYTNATDNRDDEVFAIGVSGTRDAGAASVAPLNMTNRASFTSNGEVAVHDTGGLVASWTSRDSSTVSTTYRSYVVGVRESDILIAGGGEGGGLQLPYIGGRGLIL